MDFLPDLSSTPKSWSEARLARKQCGYHSNPMLSVGDMKFLEKNKKIKPLVYLYFSWVFFFITILLSYSNLSQCSKNFKVFKVFYGQGCHWLIIVLLAKINIFFSTLYCPWTKAVESRNVEIYQIFCRIFDLL